MLQGEHCTYQFISHDIHCAQLEIISSNKNVITAFPRKKVVVLLMVPGHSQEIVHTQPFPHVGLSDVINAMLCGSLFKAPVNRP